MNTVAACFLIPLGVSIYVLTGGMRATLIADYSHTLVLYCILISFALVAYATSPIIGSPSKMWELLNYAAGANPISGNAQGSYLTMRSKSGLIFGVMMIGNFGTVFNDQAYWQRAIASDPKTSVKAFPSRLVRYSLGYCHFFGTFGCSFGSRHIYSHHHFDCRRSLCRFARC